MAPLPLTARWVGAAWTVLRGRFAQVVSGAATPDDVRRPLADGPVTRPERRPGKTVETPREPRRPRPLPASATVPFPRSRPVRHRTEADAPTRRVAQPDPAEEDQPTVPEVPSTPSGLPVRVPQANLAPPLRADEKPAAGEPADEPGGPARSPAEIQRIMGSYQRGTRRGRSEAQALGNEAEGEDEQ
ncbi:hypothetical protein [Actinomadura hibisca]|uniref:hypothetical protein n=1 Tax=Actinomadura hibisca TaxID=68565 RepID=UPI0012F7C836|nr:hypothetical protein [Actinomadura hibisca]